MVCLRNVFYLVFLTALWANFLIYICNLVCFDITCSHSLKLIIQDKELFSTTKLFLMHKSLRMWWWSYIIMVFTFEIALHFHHIYNSYKIFFNHKCSCMQIIYAKKCMTNLITWYVNSIYVNHCNYTNNCYSSCYVVKLHKHPLFIFLFFVLQFKKLCDKICYVNEQLFGSICLWFILLIASISTWRTLVSLTNF